MNNADYDSPSSFKDALKIDLGKIEIFDEINQLGVGCAGHMNGLVGGEI